MDDRDSQPNLCGQREKEWEEKRDAKPTISPELKREYEKRHQEKKIKELLQNKMVAPLHHHLAHILYYSTAQRVTLLYITDG